MAVLSNTLTDVIPQILAQGLKTLRENAIMPRLINSDLSADAAEKGDTIDVPVAAAITTRDVVPDQTATNVTITPSKVTVSLDQWKEAPFMLSDKDIGYAFDGIIPVDCQLGDFFAAVEMQLDFITAEILTFAA